MKTINIELYGFSELAEQVQEKVLEDFRYLNTDYDWWETEYEDFLSIAPFIGVATSYRQIFFKGFWSQGSGSTFEAKVDILQLINGISTKAWHEHAPILELDLKPCPIDKRVIGLIENGTIEISLQTLIPTSSNYLVIRFDQNVNLLNKVYSNIEKELEKLEAWATESLEVVNTYLYQTLKNTCDYLTGDEAVKETIELNEYLFTSNGKHADWLMDLAEQ